MSTRTPYPALVRHRQVLSPHLVRLLLDVPEGSEGLVTTGVPDEWLALTVPGQFQTRYYTVRELSAGRLTLDVVVHGHGLVTEWAQTDACVGQTVGVSAPKGSFALPADAAWVVLAGDLTALPAMARISEVVTGLPLQVHAEVPDEPLPGYLPPDTVWHHAEPGSSDLAAVVRTLDWPEGPGYFWMAGESAQMREVRRHVRRELGWDTRHHEAMGYWSGSRGRQVRAVDPGPVHARGLATGQTQAQIWAEYDAAHEGA